MEKKESSNYKKYIIDGFIFILLIWLTFSILFKNQNMPGTIEILKNTNLFYVVCGICCMIVFFLCEAINLRRNLRALGENVKLLNTLKYSIIGFFFSSITPAATGGQPMQIYFMHKDGIKVANSSLSLVVILFAFQIVTILSALISLVFFHTFMTWQLVILFIIGIFINSCALFVLTAGIFSKRLSTWIVNFTVKIMKKLRIRKIEEKENSLKEVLRHYHSSAKFIRNNKLILIKQFITTCIQELMFYSIPFFVYKAFGLSNRTYIEICAHQAIVYATVSGMPLPGAVGISEGTFVEIFKNFFGENLVKSAMLLNRLIGFYFYVIISFIVLIITICLNKKKNKEINVIVKREEKENY